MKELKTELIGKSLESERDYFLNNITKKDLYIQILKRNLNIFYSVFILSIKSKDNFLENKDTLSLYREFYAIQFNTLRFLLELFLFSTEIFSQKTDEEKNYLVHSLALSEKINTHSIDKKIFEIDLLNKRNRNKIEENKQSYNNFLKEYGKISPLVPDDIEFFFPEDKNKPNPLRNRKKKENLNFCDEFGFNYFKHNKLIYSNIIENNKKIMYLINRLQKVNMISSIINPVILKDIYSLFSIKSHPTIFAIGNFENFISKNNEEKIKIIENDKNNDDTLLKVIGILMDVLYKDYRGGKFENLEYV
jgi:hypothetical protein